MVTESTQSQPKSKARTGVILALLLLALTVVYFPRFFLPSWGQTDVSAATAFVYTIDLDFWQRTDRETTVDAIARFDLAHNLNDVPLAVGDWRGVDVPETNQEVMILLEPEQYIQRLYQNSVGQYIWLSMIGGRSSQPFHAPDICYDADGWQYNFGSQAMALDNGGTLHGLWLDAKKQLPGDEKATEHVVFYFYLFPDAERRLADGIVLFKLTSPRYGTLEETLSIQTDFVQQFFIGARPSTG
jgi:hypothetical protein